MAINKISSFKLKSESTSTGGEIFPIEVKSHTGGKLKSLKVFAEEKDCSKAFKLSKKWFEKETLKISNERILEVDSWPLYAVEGLINQELKH